MKIALVGRGKMGRAVEHLARARDWEISCICGADRPLDQGALARADVVIEFTRPDAAPGNIERILSWKKNLVVGTTGWTSRLDEVREWVRRSDCGMVYGSNFSIGMNLVFQLCEQAGKLFAGAGFSPFIFEAHHSAKKDAPSGTARELQARLEPLSGKEVSISSLRAGNFPGTHVVGFDSQFETVTLKHEVRDRQVFAEGALHAAQWVIGKKGLFTFAETLKD
ncbi:MAG TPA: dihydrodipicolinate reductase C-terminal domain-containing protein [Acidobacteriota bacterium]|jgi:4-hydroxy-tetrahydrodipicolinate reductase